MYMTLVGKLWSGLVWYVIWGLGQEKPKFSGEVESIIRERWRALRLSEPIIFEF